MWRGLGVIDRFNGLRHDAVIGSDDEHHDVGHIRTTRTHCSKSRVARCIDEGDVVSIILHSVRADVLGNPSGFTGCDARLPNRIQ